MAEETAKNAYADLTITAIEVYQVDLPLNEGSYKWSGGKGVEVFDCTIVRMKTSDPAIEGVGEVTPLGPFYLPAFAKGARAGIEELAPHLIGENPMLVGNINRIMDKSLQGHNYVKSALDMACWDILGKVCGQPVAILLGGRYGPSVELYRAISQDTPAAMAGKVATYRSEGYSKFQLKVGGSDVATDIARIRECSKMLEKGELLMADANTGWLTHQAMRIVKGVSDIDCYIEQPCVSYHDCLSVRKNCAHPFILDESIKDIDALMTAYNDLACDAINLKISKVGGLTKAKQVRDLACTLGIAMNIEDTWGGDVVTAAIAHLAHSTPQQFRLACTDFNSYVSVSIADGAPKRYKNEQGVAVMTTTGAPGLGVTLKYDVIGSPVAVHDKPAVSSKNLATHNSEYVY